MMRNLQTRDVFAAVRLVKKINARDVLADMTKETEGKTQKEVGFDVIYELIMRCAEKGVEEAFYDFISGPLEVSAKEVATMDFKEMVEKLYEIADPEEWSDFFGKVRKLNQKKN